MKLYRGIATASNKDSSIEVTSQIQHLVFEGVECADMRHQLRILEQTMLEPQITMLMIQTSPWTSGCLGRLRTLSERSQGP